MIIGYLGVLFLVLIISLFSYFILVIKTYLIINIVASILVSVYLIIRFNAYQNNLKKKRFMYVFIELFVLNFDVQKSVEATLNTLFPLLNEKWQRVYVAKRKSEGILFLEQLRSYFAHHYYESFLDMINLINERGGDIMRVSEVLLFSISNSEAQLIKLTRIDNAFLLKFSFNWVFIMLIAFIFRFALSGILDFSNASLPYLLGMEAFLAVFLVSLALVVENRIRRARYVS